MPLETKKTPADKQLAEKRANVTQIRNKPDVESSRCSGSLRNSLPLTFGIELGVFIAWDTSRFGDNAFEQYVRPNIQDCETYPKIPILKVARAILWRKGLDVVSPDDNEDDRGDGRREGQEEETDGKDYSSWSLAEDSSINSSDLQADLTKHVGGRLSTNMLRFKCGGIELASRKFTAPRFDQHDFSHPSLREIQEYVLTLEGRAMDSFACLPTTSCGLHVHVGVAARKNPDMSMMFPLGVLQHLCCIILQYESVISRLFPPWRRSQGVKRSNSISNKRTNVAKARRLCKCDKASHEKSRLDKIEEKIFADDMTVDLLASIMSQALPTLHDDTGLSRSTRSKFIDFTNLLPTTRDRHPSAPATLRFSQHESTIDPNAINHWILFVLSLVRAAESRAKAPASTSRSDRQPNRIRPQQESANYMIRSRALEHSVDELFTLLELDDHQRDHWLRRLKAFNPEEFVVEAVDSAGQACAMERLSLNPQGGDGDAKKSGGEGKDGNESESESESGGDADNEGGRKQDSNPGQVKKTQRRRGKKQQEKKKRNVSSAWESDGSSGAW